MPVNFAAPYPTATTLAPTAPTGVPSTVVAATDCNQAKLEPAATAPIVDCIPAAADPAATPALVHPKNQGTEDATPVVTTLNIIKK